MNMATIQPVDDKSSLLQPSWGSYLYQNFLMPALSPGSSLDWMINTPSINNPPNVHQQPQLQQMHQFQQQNSLNNTHNPSAADYFGLPASSSSASPASMWAENAARGIKTEVKQEPFYYPTSSTGINTSLLTQNSGSEYAQPPHPRASFAQLNSVPLALLDQQPSTDSVHVIDSTITRSPSPISSHIVSPHASPVPGPSRLRVKRGSTTKGKKRSHSVHSDSDLSVTHSHDDHDHDPEHDHESEVPEGVERDGMIWGMKVEDYRALSARERKRVRNRISARTFRAKRKEHLTSLEHTLGAKDLQIQLANEETVRLRREVIELKKRLSKYEKPYERL